MLFSKQLSFAILLLLVVSCSQPQDNTRQLESDLLASAMWIGSDEELPIEDSLFYLDHPAPLLRKTFELKKAPENALIRITAAGYYVLWINGKVIGEQELAPAWTDYSKRIYYRDFDVTEELRKGVNVISIELGNGWYNPLPLRMWGHVNLRERLNVGNPRCIATLSIEDARGKQTLIETDESWLWHPGSVIRNSIYLGEWHDDNKFLTGWKNAGFDDSDWGKVAVLGSPGGQLQLADFPPIRKTATLKPVKLWQNEPGKWIVDFGQNLAGWIKYEGPANKGDSIQFRFGERIWPDSTLNPLTAVCGQIKRAGTGGPGAPDIAEQIDVYIPSGQNGLFETKFTFHGFRYMEVTGLPARDVSEIDPNSFTAFRVGTDVATSGSFQAESEWINDIQKMVEWTFTSNLFSVASDCPAREKFGYGGDISANAEAWLYNYEMKSIYVKFIRDWKDAMREGKFVDTAPYVGINYCGIAWEGSFMMLQDWLFKFYGDLDLVREWYPVNQKWIRKAQDIIGLDLTREGLSDHESLIPVPVELIGTAYYYKSLRTMQKFAALLEDTESAKEYGEYADQIQIIMRDSLWNHPIKEFKNKQTWLATLLYHDILAPADQQKAITMLTEELARNDNRLTTGIFGTPYLLEVLSKYGHVQQAYDLVSRKEFPGWRFMLENGATTLWETWKESDNVFSQNHPMFGGVSMWLHKWIGGIDPVDGGFTRMMIHPAPVNGIDKFSVTRSYNGKEVGVSWKRSKSIIEFELLVPDNSEIIWMPQLLLPTQLETILGPDGAVMTSDNPQIVFNDPGRFKLTYKIK
ncbi:MAG: family 78 glycoside hydrolase catalytic domain [Bacteroidetes bacterium]|nr:family 78 glycoside hydrolase catalytic domain [Bacteroidota bacterium]